MENKVTYSVVKILHLRADREREHELEMLIGIHKAELKKARTALLKMRQSRASSLRDLHFTHKEKQTALAKNSGLTQASISRIVSDITYTTPSQ